MKGSMTEYRGFQANMQMGKEIVQLCGVIQQEGKQIEGIPGLSQITFGELFHIYESISDKVVGVLIRARKHEFLTFEGEMLYQHVHGHVIIKLLHPYPKVKELMHSKLCQTYNPDDFEMF